MPRNKLYVGNLSYSTDEAGLRKVFSAYGDVTEVSVITDRDTGRSKGFAFVTFGSADAADKALEQDGRSLDGRPMHVSMARERDAGRGRTGGGGSRPR